jgi:hypothetical protein
MHFCSTGRISTTLLFFPSGFGGGKGWLVTTILLFLLIENIEADFMPRERRRSGKQK